MILHSFKDRTKGFTIIELIIVIVVIGILAAIGIVAYNGVTKNARDKTLISDLDGVASELGRYSTKNNGTYGNAVAWYSGGSPNANIKFTPSSGNVIDVTANTQDYCVRAYNPSSSNPTITTAVIRESSPGICIALNPSVAAGGNGANDLLAWYKLNGGIVDSSGNNADATNFGATLTTGQNSQTNGAYAFNGTSQYFTIAPSHNVAKGTVSLWIKAAASQGGTGGYLFSHPQAVGNNRIYLTVDTTGTILYGRIADGTTIGSSTTTANTWHLVTLTWSGTTANFYVDGASVTSTSSFGGLNAKGALSYIGYQATGGFFAGSIDDIRTYNAALTATQIQRLYSLGAQ